MLNITVNPDAIRQTSYSQIEAYQSILLNKYLADNANAIVRLDSMEISIGSQQQMDIRRPRIVTILNDKGNRHLQAAIGYNNSIKIKIGAWLCNTMGTEADKFKERDFSDISLVDNGHIFSDLKCQQAFDRIRL